MCYFLLRQLFRLAVKIYFSNISIHKEEAIAADRPLLLVANHTSSIMDAILLAVLLDRPLHFLARGESFDKAWKRWLWGCFNMIPIYRREFTPALVKNNDDIFLQCSKLLRAGGSLAIFPEGKSKIGRSLGPIKTGAARILLRAAADSQYKLPLAVIPIGLNYSNPHRFRSKVLVKFGAALSPGPVYKLHQKNPEQAIHLLTDQIKNAISANLSPLPRLPLFYRLAHKKTPPYFSFLLNELLVAYAYLNHCWMLKTTRWLTDRICKRPDFYGSIQLGLGTVVFIFCYMAQVIGMFWLSASATVAMLYMLSLVMSGWWALGVRGNG